MSKSETQSRLLGGPSGESTSIETSGRVIRPALRLPSALVDETKPIFDDEGVHIRAVDPANVGMIDLHIRPEAFEEYHVDADAGLLASMLDNSEWARREEVDAR